MAVMNRRRPYFIAAHQFVLNINLNLILITEMIEPILDGFISSLLLGCLGTATMLVSTIYPFGAENHFEAEMGPTAEKVFRSVLPG